MKNPSDFNVGEIYKKNVGSRSHVRHPYFVEIIKVGSNFIITYIPGEHSLEITQGTFEWDYHTKRMEFVGTTYTHGHLIHNQENLYKG